MSDVGTGVFAKGKVAPESVVALNVTSRKLIICLLASMVIRNPLLLKCGIFLS